MNDIISRLRALKLEVIVSTETRTDTAVCAIMETGIEYKNPYYPAKNERGWTEAQQMCEEKRTAILADITGACDEIERLNAENAQLRADLAASHQARLSHYD